MHKKNKESTSGTPASGDDNTNNSLEFELAAYLWDKRQRPAATQSEVDVSLWIKIAENPNLPQDLRDSAADKIARYLDRM